MDVFHAAGIQGGPVVPVVRVALVDVAAVVVVGVLVEVLVSC